MNDVTIWLLVAAGTVVLLGGGGWLMKALGRGGKKGE